jgi:hypothetical protein
MERHKLINKLPSELSEEELLSSASNVSTEAVSEDVLQELDTLKFLTQFNIQSGAYPIGSKVLYNIYRQWSKTPVTNRIFQNITTQHLINGYISLRRYYYINISTFKLSEKSILLSKKNLKDKRKSPRYKQHFENFINHFSLDKGEFVWIPSYVLFYLYDRWVYSYKKTRPLGRTNFVKFCSLYFEEKRIGSNQVSWYSVSKGVYSYVSEKEIKELKEAQKKHKKVKKNEPKITY